MIVARKNVKEVVKNLLDEPKLALDTETLGLAYGDRLFSIIIGTDLEQYYFNFYDSFDHLGKLVPEEYTLDIGDLDEIEPLFRQDRLWFMHNAKFDLHKLDLEGSSILGEVHDTEVVERLLYNIELSYSLDNIGLRRGYPKDSTVEEYIAKHKLYSFEQIPGKKNQKKNKKYYLVPYDILVKYGETDCRVTYQIGMEQLSELSLQQ